MLQSEFSVNFHFSFTFSLNFHFWVKIQFGHFLENDVIGKRDDIIEIGFFFT